MADPNEVLMEGVRIVFRNFKGRKGKYNAEGQRNFAVVISDEVAEVLSNDGWDVKQFKRREDDPEDETPPFFLPVKVKYDGARTPPRIVIITSTKRRYLEEEEVDMVDWVDIKNVDLIVRPYPWGPINGKYGISAYLKAIYVTIEEDALEQKYDELDIA